MTGLLQATARARGYQIITAGLLTLGLLLGLLAGTAGTAQAQDPDNYKPFATLAPKGDAPAQAAAPVEAPAEKDEPALSKSKGSAIFFWFVALILVAGSIFVITRRNLITAAMGMVGTFFGIAAVYAMLFASFLTVIQVLVYAGAIMVLFVFVIMILNKPETEPWSITNLPGKVVIMGLLGYLFVRFVTVLWNVVPDPAALEAPAKVAIVSATGTEDVLFGTTRALGNTLFTDYLFPFEAVSLVLLIAVVGAIAVARPHEPALETVIPDGSADAPGAKS